VGGVAKVTVTDSQGTALAWAAQGKWTDRIHQAWHETPNRRMEIAFCKTPTTTFPAVTVTAFLPDDANGKPMPNIRLLTSGKRGPYAGRSA
jgi:hypothetical protein